MKLQINDALIHPQVKGFGEIVSTVFLTVDIGAIISSQETRKFLLALTIVANGRTYNLSNIYAPTDVVEGSINIGNITLIGEIDTDNPKWQVTAEITYLNVVV